MLAASQNRLRPFSGARASPASRRSLQAKALFGWGKEDEWKKAEKEEAYRIQQELLAKRKTGEAIKEASERRANVKSTMKARKDERAKERELLAQGIMPETLKSWKPYQKKEDEEGTGGIIVPLLPFGIRKYDEGERFDLRSPYADMGWVDPEETDMFAGFKNFGKKFLNFSGKEPERQEGKPILWASDYERYKREKEGKQ